jgi:PAS domain S-box-containing protein
VHERLPVDPEDLPDGVLIADADGQVLVANQMAARLLGVAQSELIGAHLTAAMALDDRRGNEWCECVRPYDGFGLRTLLIEQEWHTVDGRALLVTARLCREEPGGAVQQVSIGLRDARARARLEREHSELVATVAHELRSPLTGVKGFTATLLSRWDRFTDSQRRLMLQTVDSDADRLTRLIGELLDVARIDSGRLQVRAQPADLEDLAKRVIDSVAAGTSRHVGLSAERPLPTVWVDVDRLTQVITNLVENALRHGGGSAQVLLRGKDDGVQLIVDDDGPGVPSALRARVFTRFWTSGGKGGTGLGLYIVAGVVTAHGGQVSIDDAPGGGARLVVWLPRNEPDVLAGLDPLPAAGAPS